MSEPSSTEFSETKDTKLPPEAYSPFPEKSVKLLFTTPSRTTYSTISYDSSNSVGDELEPGKRIIYIIPEDHQNRAIRDIVLVHRKDPSRFSGEKHTWDPEGAYSRVLVKTDKDEWKGWIDPQGYKSDKFAEPRPAHDPENEVLHDWIATVGKIKPKLISVENVGKGKSAICNVHKLEIVFYPEEENVTMTERIFSPGTSFIDPKIGKLTPTYGGGQRFDGVYPDAIPLGGFFTGSENIVPLNQNESIDDQGRLHLKLQPGKRFINLEMAVGDTHPDKINRNGHVGTRGWAKIHAGIKKAGSEKGELFMTNVNVPPEGVLSGGPATDNTGEDNDEIVISSKNDTTYLMGYRITYGN